jgi:hypothetical protein
MDFILVELHLSVQQERHSSAFSASIFLADGANLYKTLAVNFTALTDD